VVTSDFVMYALDNFLLNKIQRKTACLSLMHKPRGFHPPFRKNATHQLDGLIQTLIKMRTCTHASGSKVFKCEGSVKGEGHALTQRQHIHMVRKTSYFPLVARSLGLQVIPCPNGQVSDIFQFIYL
jgi:hypothetical protein